MTYDQAVKTIQAPAYSQHPDADPADVVRQAAKAQTRRSYFLFIALAAIHAMGAIDTRAEACAGVTGLAVVLPGDHQALTELMAARAVAGEWGVILATAVTGLMCLPEVK